MKKKLIFAVTFIIFCCISCITKAQVNVSKVSVNAGWIRNLQDNFGNDDLYAFYPELQIGGQFLKKYFEWNLCLGYWDDGIKEEFKIRDAATYSYSSYIVGSKIYFLPQKLLNNFPLPVHIITGFTYSFLKEKYIGGSDYAGNSRTDDSYNIFSFNLGLGIGIELPAGFKVKLDGDAYIPVKHDRDLILYANSSSLKFGIDYYF